MTQAELSQAINLGGLMAHIEAVLQRFRTEVVNAGLAGKVDNATMTALAGRVSDIEAIIGDASTPDADNVINKVREMVAFFANVSESDTLVSTIASLNAAITALGTAVRSEHVFVTTLSSAPDETTLSYTTGSGQDAVTRQFKIGDEVRVYDSENGEEETNNYVFYKLYDLVTENGTTTAYWTLGGAGGSGGGATGKVKVYLKDIVNGIENQSPSFAGVKVTLRNTTDDTIFAEKTLAAGETGCTFTKVAPLKSYAVSVTPLDAQHDTPTAASLGEMTIGGEMEAYMRYQQSRYTVVYESNQGSGDSVLEGKQVSYADAKYADVINVPASTVITASDITPDADTAGEYAASVSVSGTTITVSYRTCAVTLTLTASDGAADFLPSGDDGKIAIGGKTVSSGGTLKFPLSDTPLTVTLPVTTGYQTPALASITPNTATVARTLQYLTNIYTIRFLSNQDADGTPDADIDRSASGVQGYVRYQYGGTTVNGGKAFHDGDTIKVPADADTSSIELYNLSNKTADGYSVGTPVVDASARTVTATYSTTIVTAQVSSNQSGADLSGVVCKVNGTAVTSSAGKKVPTGEAFTFTTENDLTGYRKTISGDSTPSAASQTVSVEYDAELLSVALSADQGTPDLTGVTINVYDSSDDSVVATGTGSISGQPIASGTTYYVGVTGTVSGYGNPANSTPHTAADTGNATNSEALQYVYGVLNVEVTTSDNDDTDLAKAKCYITLGSAAEREMTGGITNHVKTFSISVEPGTQYSIRFGAVDGYQTPNAIGSQTKGTGVTTLTGNQYQTNVYTLQDITTTKDGNVQGNNPEGVGVSLTYTGLENPITLSAVGDTAKVPANLTPTITPNTVYGYKATKSEDTGHNISLTYATTAYTLNVSTNQPTDDDIAQTVIRISATGISSTGYRDFTGAQSNVEVLVPAGETVTAVRQGNAPTGYAESIAVSGTTVSVEYQTELLTVSLSADNGTPDLTGVTITVRKADDDSVITTGTGSISGYKIPYGTEYYVEVDGVNGYTTPTMDANRTAAAASHTVSLEYEEVTIVYSGIKIDQTKTDPTTMITRMTNSDNALISASNPTAAIDAIRAAAYRCVGTFANGTMTVKKLDNTDGTLYADGTSAATDIATQGKDVFLRLPNFHYKVLTTATDKFNVMVAIGGTPPDEGWKSWSDQQLLGVYEAVCSDTGNNTTGGLYSRSGATPTVSVSQANFKQKARNRGTGFHVVTYEWHCIMALLYYMQYGPTSTNCQALIGAGTSSYPKVAGGTNSLGMEDTVAGGNGDSGSINFLGVENWWGDIYEWVDNIVVSNRSWVLYDPLTGSSVRTIGTGPSSNSWIQKIKFGEYFDMLPTTVSSSASATAGFCDYYYQSSGSLVFARSHSGPDTFGGVACVLASFAASNTFTYRGSRLAFSGTIVES